MSKRGAMVAGVIVVALAALVAWQWLVQAGQPGWGNAPFDAQRWRKGKHWERDNERGKMVRSLLRSVKLVGMSRSQVADLLGPPDGIDGEVHDDLRVQEPLWATARTFYYVLGAYSGFRMDYDMLILDFGATSRVRSWRIEQG